MKRVLPIAAMIVVVIVAALAATPGAVAAPVTPESPRVTIVLAPHLAWSDISAASTPNLWRMAEQGAVGAVNARSRLHAAGEPGSVIESALLLSAGSWVKPEPTAMAAYNATEPVTGSLTCADVYAEVFGGGMGGAQIAYLGQLAQARPDAGSSVVIGSLGQAVRSAGGQTVAVGNSDAGFDLGRPVLLRPAAVVAADRRGLVAYGDVSADLLGPAPAAPFGVATDLGRFERAYDAARSSADRGEEPSLVVLDPGDATRARGLASQATSDVARMHWQRALGTLDAVIGMAEKRRGPDGLVIVVSQALSPDAGGLPAGLGPIVVSGRGWSGYVTSPSTHRDGLVTSVDVGATALRAMRVDQPLGIMGDAMVPVDGPESIDERVSALAGLSADAVSVDAAKPGVPNTFIVLVVLALVGTVLVVSQAASWRPSTARRWVRIWQALLLLALCVPPASWLMFIVAPHPPNSRVAVASVLLATAAVWIASLLAWRRLPLRVPVAALSLGFSAVVLADQFAGAPLSRVGFFSYSPLLGARFYGMGNEAAALLLGASLIGAGMLLDQWPDTRFGVLGKHIGLPVLGILVVGTAAAPFLGANVGAAVWAVAGFVCAWTLMDRRTIGLKSVLVIVALSVALIGVFSAIDLLGGGEQTHLGRALTSARQGGLSELWAIVTRKAAANVHVLTTSNSSWILVAVLGLLAFARLRPASDFAGLSKANPNLVAAIVASLVAGAIAFVTEDSGIVVPSLIMLYSGVAVAWLLLARIRTTRGEVRQ